MGKRRNRNASTPATDTVTSEKPTTDETPVVDTIPEVTPEATETPEVIPENTPEVATDETPVEDEATAEDKGSDDEPKEDDEPEKASADPKVFWVEGYGNVNAKSQAEAEKKARKILADQRK